MNEYQKFLEQKVSSLTSDQLLPLISYHQIKISEYQHERLAHLLVTITVAISLIILVTAALLSHNTWLAIASIPLIILLFFYLLHYHKLENDLQKLYRISEKLFLNRLQTQ